MLKWVEHAINNSVYAVTGQTPYYHKTGFDAITPNNAWEVHGEPEASWVRHMVQSRRMAELARENANARTFNIWHETLTLSPVDGHLMPLLDGTRDRDALVEALLEFDREDLIRFERDGQRLTGPELRTAAAEYIDEIPKRLAAMKLFRGNDHTEAGGAS